MGGWVLFRCETFTHAVGYYAALAGQGAGDPARHKLAEYVDPLVATTLAIAVAGAMPIARRIGEWRDARAAARGAAGTIVIAVDIAWLGLVGLASCAWLAAGTYNPFIYFRF